MITIICKYGYKPTECTQVMLDISAEDIPKLYPKMYEKWLIDGLKGYCRKEFSFDNLNKFLSPISEDKITVDIVSYPLVGISKKAEKFFTILQEKGIDVEDFMKDTITKLS